MEPYQPVAEEDTPITINLKLSDDSVRPVSMSLSATVSDLKAAVRPTQAFEQELASGQSAVLVFQGKFMKDAEQLSAFRTLHTGLFDQCFVHAVLNLAPSQPSPVQEADPDLQEDYSRQFLAAMQLAAALRQREPQEEEGTYYDLAWGVLFGFLLHVLMILCVSCTQFISGRLNKKQKLGVVIGIVLQMMTVFFTKRR